MNIGVKKESLKRNERDKTVLDRLYVGRLQFHIQKPTKTDKEKIVLNNDDNWKQSKFAKKT